MGLKKILVPCIGLSTLLTRPFNDIAGQLGGMGVELGFGVMNATGSLCAVETDFFYGRTITYATGRTDIEISTRLLWGWTPNVLYNVLYHEVLHAFGLQHSTNPGLMNYSLTVDFWGRVVEADVKLWMSVYDLIELFKKS